MSTDTSIEFDIESLIEPEEPWLVVLKNDPVNSMEYVVFALKSVFGYDTEKANSIMLTAHEKGQAIAWAGPSTQAQAYATALSGWNLWASLKKDSK